MEDLSTTVTNITVHSLTLTIWEHQQLQQLPFRRMAVENQSELTNQCIVDVWQERREEWQLEESGSMKNI